MNRRFINQLHFRKHKLYRFLKRWRGRLLESLGFYGSLSWDGIQPIFLLSTGRTGTTFLATLFSKFDGVTAFHEPQPDLSDLALDYIRKNILEESVKPFLRANRQWVLTKAKENSSRIYFEANHFLFSLPEIMAQVFPKPKFIHIIRDGRDVVRTGYTRGWYSSTDMYDRPRAREFTNDPFHQDWSQFSRFEKIAWYWQFKDRALGEALQSVSPVQQVYFENIFHPDEDFPGLREIFSFVGVEPTGWRSHMDNKVRSTKTYALPHWHNWSKQRRHRFGKIAGDHLNKHDYGWDGPTWA